MTISRCIYKAPNNFFFLNNSKNISPSFSGIENFWNFHVIWELLILASCSFLSLGSSSFLLPFTLINWKTCQAGFDFSWYTVNSLSYMHIFFLNLRRVLFYYFYPIHQVLLLRNASYQYVGSLATGSLYLPSSPFSFSSPCPFLSSYGAFPVWPPHLWTVFL